MNGNILRESDYIGIYDRGPCVFVLVGMTQPDADLDHRSEIHAATRILVKVLELEYRNIFSPWLYKLFRLGL
jgi:hypothetical protein